MVKLIYGILLLGLSSNIVCSQPTREGICEGLGKVAFKILDQEGLVIDTTDTNYHVVVNDSSGWGKCQYFYDNTWFHNFLHSDRKMSNTEILIVKELDTMKITILNVHNWYKYYIDSIPFSAGDYQIVVHEQPTTLSKHYNLIFVYKYRCWNITPKKWVMIKKQKGKKRNK